MPNLNLKGLWIPIEVLTDKIIDKIYKVIIDNASLKDDVIKEIKKLIK